MILKKFFANNIPSAQEEVDSLQDNSSYKLAFLDNDFLLRKELRPIRLQLELLKPEIVQQEQNVKYTIVIFGSARIHSHEQASERVAEVKTRLDKNPDSALLQREYQIAQNLLEKSKYYEEARKLSQYITRANHYNDGENPYVVTGGGPGIMEAANRGAHEVGGKSIGVGIVLPFEEKPNQYVTPELTFKFHYFSLRKMHFLMRAQALVAFPGGFGTLDELFETLTLMQTQKIHKMPVILFGKSFWQRIIDFEALVDEGVVSPGDLDLFQYAETAKQAWEIIEDHLKSTVHIEAEETG